MASGGGSKRALEIELKGLIKEPVEGFTVHLHDDSDMFVWDIQIFGPPETLYQGGYFKAQMSFPKDYPYSPPKLKFLTPMFHPNIYPAGNVCISILHAPGLDEMSGELASERWNPTQSVRTILLSVVSLLSEPNISSPANVDASVMFRKWKAKESNVYEMKVREQVAATEADAERDGVVVPKTLDDYCVRRQKSEVEDSMDYDMYSDDDGDIGYEEDDDDENDADVDDEGAERVSKPEDNDSGMN